MRLLYLIFFVLLIDSCKTVGNNSGGLSTNVAGVAAGDAPPFLNRLATVDDYNKLSVPNDISYPLVRFVHLYGLPETDPHFDSLYMQNSRKFEEHKLFLAANIERYKDVVDYNSLILPPSDPETPSVKEITAGVLYYRPAEGADTEMLAYTIHFPVAGTRVKIDVEEVARFDKKLKSSIGMVPASSINFIIDNEKDALVYQAKLKAAGVNVVGAWNFLKPPKDIGPNGEYTYNREVSYGVLRNLTPTELEEGRYNFHDILILEHTPLDIAPVSGLVTMKMLPPHSHIILRVRNLKVPGIHIPDALSIPDIKNNINKLVKITTGPLGSYKIEDETKIPAIVAEAENYWKSKKVVIPTPIADTKIDVLKVWNKSRAVADDIKAYGAKATNFAILDQALTEAKVNRTLYTNGFMVPFSFFKTHMDSKISAKICKDAAKKCEKDTGKTCSRALALCDKNSAGSIYEYAKAMLGADNLKVLNEDPLYRREFLGFIQRLIRETPLDPRIADPIRQAMTAYPADVRMRLRSSTNAEDIQGLNGAGLYESKSACLGDAEDSKDDDGKQSACRTELEKVRLSAQAEKLRTMPDPDGRLKALADEMVADITKKYPLSKTIRNVYASLWTERAFLTREHYGLDHLRIFMGMLSHPSFVDESANGVAVVSYKNDLPENVKINVQYDDISVTNPIFPDTYAEEWTVQAKLDGTASRKFLIRQSTLSSAGKSVLTTSEVSELVKQLFLAATAIREARGGNLYDLEFILGKNREVLIKQGRPL